MRIPPLRFCGGFLSMMPSPCVLIGYLPFLLSCSLYEDSFSPSPSFCERLLSYNYHTSVTTRNFEDGGSILVKVKSPSFCLAKAPFYSRYGHRHVHAPAPDCAGVRAVAVSCPREAGAAVAVPGCPPLRSCRAGRWGLFCPFAHAGVCVCAHACMFYTFMR